MARVVADLVRAQVAAGMRVVVACPGRGPLAVDVAALGAETETWHVTRDPGPGLPAEIRRVAALAGHVRPDVVHAHSAKAGFAGRLAVRGRIPTVFQPHAWSFEAVSGTTAALARSWERLAARWTARVLCVSEAERARGERAGVRARWSVVPNGVDTDRFGPAGPHDAPAPAAAAARAALPALAQLPPDTPLVVCVGRLCRQKGQDVLLRAWPLVLRDIPGARLVLVGDGPDAARLRADAPPSVLFAGAVRDTAPWYRAADLVVLPSRWEGMAVAPLEAMAGGRAVLLSDVDGARESLPPEAHPHCLTPPEDPVATATAVTALLRDRSLRDTLGRLGHDHVRRTHDVRRTARAVADVYREVAPAPRSEGREPILQ
ncbi:glycosyltransferase family 4 protein [Streptomyces sp. NBC_01498]|uniref:glycosyltransferase family 4 protein n=1 Tax=Streptomyces sp. NBC_01498 TaxID=2975870 RepID=UPI002E7B5322|nr:glycosyltransferase family 4 protein [Streptomyces sp. NBC_01498]WTL26367.1 glycosyltransferase family 4 protein [Streptomyces sp. NBC_01498]